MTNPEPNANRIAFRDASAIPALQERAGEVSLAAKSILRRALLTLPRELEAVRLNAVEARLAYDTLTDVNSHLLPADTITITELAGTIYRQAVRLNLPQQHASNGQAAVQRTVYRKLDELSVAGRWAVVDAVERAQRLVEAGTSVEDALRRVGLVR